MLEVTPLIRIYLALNQGVVAGEKLKRINYVVQHFYQFLRKVGIIVIITIMAMLLAAAAVVEVVITRVINAEVVM